MTKSNKENVVSKSDKSKMKELLLTILQGAEVEEGKLGSDSVQDYMDLAEILNRYEKWRPHIGWYELMDFSFRRISQERQIFDQKLSGSLADLLTKSKFDQLRTDIEEFLLSIPREYEMWVELPSMPKWGGSQIVLSPRISISEVKGVRTGLSLSYLSESMPASNALKILRGKSEETSVYLRIKTSGYARGNLDASAISSALSYLKQFLELTRNAKYFSAKSSLAPMLSDYIGCDSYIIDCETSEEFRGYVLPAPFQKYLSAIVVNESELRVFDEKAGKTLLASFRVAVTSEEKAEALKEAMRPILNILDYPSNNSDAIVIKSALEWAFDSKINENQTIAFLQACIGLEAILGDDEKDEPLVSRLADRCAYLLGRGFEDRKSIRRQFKSIYDSRSKLIHGRKARLDRHELGDLYVAQQLLGDVIAKEVEVFNGAMRTKTKALAKALRAKG